MSALKLSIIVPVYNVEKYLESLCGLKVENEIIVLNYRNFLHFAKVYDME